MVILDRALDTSRHHYRTCLASDLVERQHLFVEVVHHDFGLEPDGIIVALHVAAQLLPGALGVELGILLDLLDELVVALDWPLISKAIALAVSLQQQDRTEDAIEKWRGVAHVAEDSDNDQAARAWLSVGYLLAQESPEDSISTYGRAIRLKPDFAEAYSNRGHSKEALGRHDDAITDYDKAIRLKRNLAEAYTNRGVSKGNLGRHDDAIADHDEAIRLKPGYAEAYYNRGLSKDELGRHDDAIADYDKAIRLKPDFAEAYSNRGHSKEALGRHDDAIADCIGSLRRRRI